MKYKCYLNCFLVIIMLIFTNCTQQQKTQSVFKNSETLHNFFRYKGDGSLIISGHRGSWKSSNYPDNSLEGLQYAAEIVPNIFFEIDPRLTKDSVIVLLHDATLDRTTNVTGKLADYTWEELDTVRLRDYKGNLTSCKIPTLEEVLLWSKGKTLLNLDRKDVPPEMIVDLIRKCDAENHIMLTVHSGAQASYYYKQLPEALFSARIRNQKEYNDYAVAGIPWENMIAYVGQTIDESNKTLVDTLHSRGVRCMIALSPTHDRLDNSSERSLKYKEEILRHPDIIETDYPIEVWNVWNNIQVKHAK